MRFLRLDLERYGPFTDRRVDFREGARLHLVYGRNEAGKSTALAAVTDLLFGFPQRASQDYLHRPRDLRVGARIVERSGRTIEFRRRRGNLRTLIDAEETPLPDDLLEPCLGGVTREVFTRAFGLSTEALREGGSEMLKEKGDIGSALFAAASGLNGPSRLKRALEAEAERIFADKRAGHRSFYQALDRREEARKAESQLRLRSTDWKELNERIESAATEQARIDAERAKLTGEAARLTRHKRLAPLLLLLDEAAAELDRLDIAVAQPGYAKRLAMALDAEERAAQQRRDCAKALDELTSERDRIIVDEVLLERANEVAALFAESGQYAKAKIDLPGVDREAQGLRHAVEMLAKRLGLSDPSELAARLPQDADLALMRGLYRQGRALEAEIAGLGTALARERDAASSLGREEAQRGEAPTDPAPLRERLAEIDPVLRRLQQGDELQREIEREERALAEGAARLDPKIASLDALAKAPLPGSETMARFRKEFEAVGKALERASEEVQSAERACAEIEGALEKLGAGRAVPTAEAIASERRKRGADWEKLRAALFGAELSPDARSSSVASFELRMAEADRLADEALGDAKRVAQHAVQAKALETERKRLASARRALAETELRNRKLAQEWRAAWAASGIVPLTPAEMASWSSNLATLLERRSRLEEKRAVALALASEESAVACPLRETARAAGLAGLDAMPNLQVAARLETRLRRLTEAWETARGLLAKLAAARERIAQDEATLEEASSRSRDWMAQWRKALPKLGLAPETNLDAAEAALEIWAEVPERLHQLAREERRVAGMRRDNADFERRAENLFRAVAPDLVDALPQTAAHSLSERAAAAARNAALRRDCASRLLAAGERDRAADKSLREARAALSAIAGEIGAIETEDLHSLLARLERRAELEAALRSKREELLRAADGLDEAMVRDELAGFDASLADQLLAGLSEDDKRLLALSREVYAARQEALRHKGRLETGIGAELAAQLRRNAESELALGARRWAVLKLGSLLIGQAIERHRQAAQNPLLSRAANLFAAIAGGAFVGLSSRVDEDDMPALVGQRPDGSQVGVDGMSEGTRDQLYLALRLAYVESYAMSLEPPPFIADDIFVTFDDERTVRGLEALAGIGHEVQCILFTHHRHTAEIAGRRLGDKVDIIEL